MRQFDVLTNTDAHSADWAPYLVALQHDLLRDLETIVVAPLVRQGEGTRPMSGLNPVVEFSGERLVVSVQELAGVSRRQLGNSVGSLESQRQVFLQALDLLFTGV